MSHRGGAWICQPGCRSGDHPPEEMLATGSHCSIPASIFPGCQGCPASKKPLFPGLTLKTTLQIPESRESSHPPAHPLQLREGRSPSQPWSVLPDAGLAQNGDTFALTFL